MSHRVTFVLVSLFIAACGGDSPIAFDGALARSGAPLSVEQPYGLRAQAGQAGAPQQMIIRSGDLRVQVDDVEVAVRRADSLAQGAGGFTLDSRVSQDDRNRRHAEMSLNVPAARFRETMQALKALGDVKGEGVNQQDIGKAYADLETRLAVKEQAVGRLRRLLADQTGKLSDVLDVEREINRVVTEIEQMKGERRYYDNQVALSTISLNLFEPGALVPGSPSIGDAFRQALEVLGLSVVWLVYLVTFLTPWLAFAGGIWWTARAIRKRWKVAG